MKTMDSFNVEIFDLLLNYLNQLDSKFHKIVKRGLEVVADYFSETLYCAYALKSIENCLKRLNHNEINLSPGIKVSRLLYTLFPTCIYLRVKNFLDLDGILPLG